VSKNEIWKLQRPLFSSDGNGDVMAYTEDKKRTAMIPLPGELVDELFGEEPKIYVLAQVKRGNLCIDKRVAEQDW
jgi:hypothetical protein